MAFSSLFKGGFQLSLMVVLCVCIDLDLRCNTWDTNKTLMGPPDNKDEGIFLLL